MPTAAPPPADAWTEWGGDGPRLVFSHANGFPPASYRALLDRLTPSFEVASFAHRPLWSDEDPSGLLSWEPMAEDLRATVASRRERPVVGVGHSLGGVLCSLAAAREPGLFAALVLLDPVVFSGLRSLVWGWSKRLGLGDRFPLARIAARRRDRWPDRESVRRSWRERPVFASWHPRAFDDYLDAGLTEMPDGGVRLRYPRLWEARIFEICPHDLWRDLRRTDVPVLVVRGETSDTLLRGAARRLVRNMPDATLVELEGTSHFLPMEQPDEVARFVVEFAEKILGRES